MVPPAGPLADAVECIWVCRRPDAGGSETVLPSGRAQLVFGLDEEHSVATFVGPARHARSVDAGAQRFAVGVVFRPGGLRSVTGYAASDFVDTTVAVDEVLSVDPSEIADRLRSASTSARRGQVMSKLTMRQLTLIDRPPSPEVRKAAKMLGCGHGVAGTAAAVGELPRRLRSTFRDEVGMTPKTLARLQRFNGALRAVRSPSARDLAELAVAYGYADQSHMTRDFGEFAGITPGSVHGDGSATPTHLDD